MDRKPKKPKAIHYQDSGPFRRRPACGAVGGETADSGDDVTCKNCLRRMAAWGVPGIRVSYF